MKKMYIYEPAMCCDTGLCGVGVDPELLRVSTVLNNLKKKGIIVERYNLSSAPMKFITNEAVNKLINEKGVEELPAIVLDDEIVIKGRYPSNEEFAKYLDVSIDFIGEGKQTTKRNTNKSGGCGCSDGRCC